jgi:AcrR family transcriptional regulator
VIEETVLSSPSATPGGKEQKNERVREILAAALEEFFQQGFAAARLDAIAERAGIGKGTVYLYFDSKETLFEEAVRSVILPVIDHIESVALAPQGSAEMLLRAMITTFYRKVVATERRRLLRLLIAEGPRFPRLVSFYHAEVLTRAIAAIRHVLRYGVERGEFAADAAIEYPQAIMGPALVGAIWKLLFDDIEPIDLERLCSAHLEIVLRGLIARA